MENIAYIYQPHYKTDMARVAVTKQQGKEYNYIVITCSESRNGLYRYPVSILKDVSTVANGKLICYCIPMSKTEFVCSLSEIEEKSITNKVKAQQKEWYENQIRNRDYEYKSRPDWML